MRVHAPGSGTGAAVARGRALGRRSLARPLGRYGVWLLGLAEGITVVPAHADGALNSALWTQMTADIFGQDIRCGKDRDASTIGAAALALHAAGALEDVRDFTGGGQGQSSPTLPCASAARASIGATWSFTPSAKPRAPMGPSCRPCSAARREQGQPPPTLRCAPLSVLPGALRHQRNRALPWGHHVGLVRRRAGSEDNLCQLLPARLCRHCPELCVNS